jgi:hypothetical protein
MALEGSLSDFGLADILQLIYFQRKTGLLTLDGKLDRVRLLFKDGNIVGAESKRRIDDNRLGKILLKRGLISEGDLQTALEEQKKNKTKLGNILVDRELIRKEVIGEIINGQITETVIQLFNWKQGTYEFTSQGIPEDKVLSTSLDTQHLLMEGLRLVDEWSLIRGKVTLDTVFRKRGDFSGELDDEEAGILKFVDGENDVSTIIDLSGGDNFHISKTLLSLMEKGVVEEVEEAPLEVKEEGFEKKKTLHLLRLLVPAAFCISLVLSLTITVFYKGGLAKELSAGGKLDTLRFKIEAYKLEHSSYPPRLDAVSAEKDPWGHPYIYRISDDSFYLASAGADGKEGTQDDIY